MQSTMKMNRRNWLGTTALAAAALALNRNRALAATGSDGGNVILLDQNENPHGCSEKTRQAIADAIQFSHRYPDVQVSALRDRIAEREQVPGNCVVLGAGCTELFSLACLLYGADGKAVLAAEPTYSGFCGYVGRVGGRLTQIPVNDRWQLDLVQMARHDAGNPDLVYTCNPNNPTGTIMDGGQLLSFCDEASQRCPVFVDEAYHELVDDPRHKSMVELVRKGRRVIVGRTFSKLYGLAGLRVGYGIARPDMVAQFHRIQTNFAPLSQLSIAAARAAYVDTDYLATSKRRNAEARAGLYTLLDKLGWKAIPGSQTNFVAFELPDRLPRLVGDLRRDHHIAIRSYRFLGRAWCRISMGTREEMEKLTDALERLA